MSQPPVRSLPYKNETVMIVTATESVGCDPGESVSRDLSGPPHDDISESGSELAEHGGTHRSIRYR